MPLVPNMLGLTQSGAEAKLLEAGLKLGSVQQVPSATAAGKVVSAIPAAGESVDSGSEVKLEISTGSAPRVKVPDMLGSTQPEAEAKLLEAGLKLGSVQQVPSATAAGKVVSATPAAGESVDSGSEVKLEISTGSAPKGDKGPIIPGVLLTLIGVFALLFGKTVNGVIVCYIGVMTLIVAAGKVWMQHILRQPELAVAAAPDSAASGQPVLDVADRRAQSENAVLVACCVVGIVITALAIVCGATVTVFKGGMATGLFWGLGSLFSGGLIGFLFGIPSETERAKSTVHVNTSLNQINDWLTKIIVGVSLVNAQNAYKYFVNAARTLGAGLASDNHQLPAATAFAAGLIITFFFVGFTGTYLLTRLWISPAILRADLLTLWLSGKFPKDEGDGVPTPQATTSAIITTAIPAGTLNKSYQPTTIQTAGLTPPLNWSVTPALPAGLSLNQTTGVIDGTPTETLSQASFKFTVTDNAKPANILNADLSLEIK